MNKQYSFVVITFNEEMHLPRLLESISSLDASIFILDSGSTDNTLAIGQKYGATILTNPFENHPKQWDFALKNFQIQTPWLICLDADQIVTSELREHLVNFKDEDYKDTNGIYFNRKNFFKGKWIKHGGYYPFYLLKMFRYGVGYSDLNENMDHRFIVPGNLKIWKDGHILEENLKENKISFWINKHNRYSDLVAQEEVERMQQLRAQTLQPRFWGSPDERTARLKQIWWEMPRYVRPMIYFLYRIIFQLGILDGQTGVIFHFLQGFWFRLIVDVKIDEIVKQQKGIQKTNYTAQESPLKFVFSFILLFACFYYFNILFYKYTTPGVSYIAFLGDHLNYITGLRLLLLKITAQIVSWSGYAVITDQYNLLVAGHGIIRLDYSCLGLGVISFFAAFVLSYPRKWKSRIIFLIAGVLGIQLLNIIRFVLLAIFWDKKHKLILDHHTIFNIIIYIVIAIAIYFWVKSDTVPITENEAN